VSLGSSDERFREMFYEEARELLISLEEGLMELERRQGDRAHLDKTFRAAHSLKGAAAMVGLGTIAEFTHGIEAVLERIRSGTLAVDTDIITTLLESRDHLAAMVEGEAMGSPVPGSGELSQRLATLVRSPSGGATATAPAPAEPPRAEATSAPVVPVAAKPPRVEPAPEPVVPAIVTESAAPADGPKPPAGRTKRSRKSSPAQSSAKSGPRRGRAKMPQVNAGAAGGPSPAAANPTRYRIRLTPGADTIRRGVNLLGVLDELRELGSTTLTTDPEMVPLLDELDPQQCYLSWTISIETEADPERISDVFLFLSEDSLVRIEREAADGSLEPVGGTGQDSAGLPRVGVVERPATETLPKVEAPSLERATPPAGPPAEEPVAAEGGHAPAGIARPPAPTRNGSVAPAGPPKPHQRIRVDASQLDDLVGLAGELAVLSDNLQGLREVPGIAPWLPALESLQRISRQVRDTTLDLRMVPVDELFSRFPRVVRDLADRSGKEIELRIVGQETRLDRTIVERMNDPMTHLIRNAIDHGLETPQERIAQGKPRVGRITLSAGHEGDRVAIRVEDDGRGLDREKIARKGVARGLIAPGTAPEDPRVVGLIFEAGFSTRDNVSELSGRGVGLDVVRDAVRALRGSLTVESVPGKGTAFVFRLPLTLALIDGLLVECAGGKFVVPLAQVEECVALGGTSPALARERPCVSVRGELVPMIALRKVFRADGPLPARQELLLTRHAGQRVGVAVDRLVGRVQAVIQSLGTGLHGMSQFSGATILGDGSVSLILDLSALVSDSLIAENGGRITPSVGVRAESFR